MRGSVGRRAAIAAGDLVRRHPVVWVAALILALAFTLLGSRGIWEPDEGRYTNVAVNMLESGDWMNPRRNDEVGHWTKPPLTYWALASSLSVFGLNPWAARLPVALSYLLCAWLTWRIARRLAPGTETAAALIYATMLLPFGASQFVTSDYLLAACETLAVWAFIEARWGERRTSLWLALMWAALALAFLTKGPPGLLPLPAMLLFDRMMPGRRRILRWSGIALFLALALPWYIAVIIDNPGLFEHFVHDEVLGRVASDDFRRNGEWYGWFAVYAPTLLLGTLPWTPVLLRRAAALPGAVRRWRGSGCADAPTVLLAAWVLLPLLVFCLSLSRLPLYILPLFVPLAVLVAMQRRNEGRPLLPPWPWLLAWVLMLLSIKLVAAFLPSHKNAAEWAQAIQERSTVPVHEVIFVDDMSRYGLRLHLGTEVEKVSLHPLPSQPGLFNPVYDEDVLTELREAATEPGAIWVCRQAAWPEVRGYIASLGYQASPLGAPHRDRVIFRVGPAAPDMRVSGP